MPGKFIVIDGTDGSGKTVQTTMLIDRLTKEGHAVVVEDFPRYKEPSSYFVSKMLKGEYGTLAEQPPHRSSYFYALDRFDASFGMKENLNNGKIIVSNRFTSSNIGHQGAKFSSIDERKEFFIWLDHLEYEEFSIPRPDRVFFLHVPVEKSLELIEERLINKERTEKDIAESNPEHLRQASISYNLACDTFPYWERIECMENTNMRSKEDIHEEIYQKTLELLID